jgi:integrase
VKFTDRSLQALKPAAQRYEVWEDNGHGFGVRVAPSGRKTFVYVYRHRNKPRRLTLGTYLDISLHEAHVRHAKARKDHKQGIDPAEQEQIQKREERDAETISQLAEISLEKHAKPLLDAIVDRGAPQMANSTHALLSKLFKFAVYRGILDTTPFVEIPKPAKRKPRTRVLSEDEIRSLWQQLDASPMLRVAKLAIKLLLITGQRRGEVAKARREHVDLEKRLWTIPSDDAKNERTHVLPLTDLAVEVVEQLLATSDSPWLVPSPRGGLVQGGRHLDPATIGHELRAHMDVEGKRYCVHDLRRTAATMMTSLGVDARWVDKVLNHVEGGVIKHYDIYDYLKEKRLALETWERELRRIVQGEQNSCVVALRSV